MKIDAVVVRLTPEQEVKRQADLVKTMAARNERLRSVQYKQFLTLKAEFEGITPDEADRLITRAQIEKDAKRGMSLIGAFALTATAMAQAAHKFISFVKGFMPWNWTKTFAIRSGLAGALIWGGALSAQCVGSDGVVKWTDTLAINGITTVGLNHGLDIVFHAGTQVTTWYMGLINGSSATLAAADTMGSHAGWTENTQYSQTNRVAWDEGAASSGVTTNSTTMDFSMNATATIYGGFLTSGSGKSGTTGTLWMTAAFSGGAQSVGSGDTLKLTYTLSTSSS